MYPNTISTPGVPDLSGVKILFMLGSDSGTVTRGGLDDDCVVSEYFNFINDDKIGSTLYLTPLKSK